MPVVAPPRPAPAVDADPRERLAPLYRVLVHNDDISPMEFVVEVLKRFFRLPTGRAAGVMVEAHFTGVAWVDTLPLEEAEFRVEQAHSFARGRRYPLTFSIEPEE
ncbi:MAG: ATP-dependent Clp protease adaptor ClpS [Planctomycetes bacterium]|nr:ATP-dependent Clp protease adaptor ClpS [Planctomycetota bacterium]